MTNRFENGGTNPLLPGEMMDLKITHIHEQGQEGVPAIEEMKPGQERKLTTEEMARLNTVLEKEWENALVAEILRDIHIDPDTLKPGEQFLLSEKDKYKLALALGVIEK